MVFLAVTSFSPLNCKETNAIPKTENPMIVTDRAIPPQKQTEVLQENSTSVAQKNETAAKHDHSVTNRKPKTRQVSYGDVPVLSKSTLLDDMDAKQSYYQSALMMYPFQMTNTYYPRYFPYNYPIYRSGHHPGYYPGYQGYPYVG